MAGVRAKSSPSPDGRGAQTRRRLQHRCEEPAPPPRAGSFFVMSYTSIVYRDSIKAALSPAEQKILANLGTPRKIQDYLDTLPINFEISGETYMSPRRVLRTKTAHCFEGALLAAAAFAYHGQKPLLLDLKTAPHDEDHVVALFKVNGLFGAISKTNHATLRYRDPIYKNVRELALSYFHEYILPSGEKTLRSYSIPFDLSKFPLESWLTAEQELDWLVETLDSSKHIAIASSKQFRALRKATPFEVRTTAVTEWPRKRRIG
jgi:hypothetical protein